MRYTPYKIPRQSVSTETLHDVVIAFLFLFLAVSVGLVAHFIITA